VKRLRKLTSGRRVIHKIGKKSGITGRKVNQKKWLINWILVISAIIIGIALIFAVFRKIENHSHPGAIGTVKVDRFRDLNAVHLRFASRGGITPFKSEKAFRSTIDKLLDKNQLVKVSGNRFYQVRHLSHSHPYLTPAAAQLLNDIGRRFRDKLDEKGKPSYYFQVSSLLRTGESQRRLGRSNRNASQNSSHMYGTTFDIAYKSLIKKSFFGVNTEIADGPAIKLLSETIGELRREGRCKVVTEYFEKCFHITVVK
jgi:hypothetical protein